MWPDGARCAAAFTFDFDAEEVWIGDDPANADRLVVLSQGTYGPKVAIPLILEMLDRHGVRATFFVPGRVAERHPERVSEILAAGHEVGHHGYRHISPSELDPNEEEAELVRGREVLEALGAKITGYRSPSWELSPRSIALLERHGFDYSSNMMDDIRPYRHEGTSVVEVPVHWILDDAAHFWFDPDTWTKKISTVGEVRELWDAEFAGIRELGGACVFTMHPQIIGRPGRLPLLEAMLTSARQLRDVWIATLSEIAGRV